MMELIEKERSCYVLAAVISACENNGILHLTSKNINQIIKTHLDIFRRTAKTPSYTMRSTVGFQRGEKYFNQVGKCLFALKELNNLHTIKIQAELKLKELTEKL